MAAPNVIEEITELPSVAAHTKPGRDGSRFAVRVNRALASALAIRHRVSHRLDIRSNLPPPVDDQHSPEEKLLRAIFGEAAGPPADGAVVEQGATITRWTRVIEHREGWLAFDGAERGVVESVTREKSGLPKGIGERITVIVGWPGPLEVGDVLHSGDAAIGIVEGIEDDGSSEPRVFYGAGGGVVEVSRRLPTATQAMEARSIGPYSLVSQNPVSGQRIRPGQIAWLAEHGCRALAGEFATYKTNDVTSRTRLYETLAKGEPVKDPWSELRPPPRPPAPPSPAPALPGGNRDIFNFFERPADKPFTNTQLATLDVELRVLGLGITLDGHDLRLALRPPDKAAEWSFGEVKKPETINYRTHQPEAGGLFCQKIFGPVRDYACACGKYKRMKHRGLVCEKCGVEVIQSRVRRERTGHVTLPAPVVPRHLRRLVSALIGESAKAWLPGIDADGGASLREKLARADAAARARALPSDHRDRRILEAFASSGVMPQELPWDVLPVLPPDLRPLVPLPGGRFATSDLNDLYRRVINRSNRLKRLLELKAPDAILVNERKMLRQAVDQLLFNGAKGLPVVKFQERKLMSLFRIVKKKFHPDPGGIRADYSGAATVLVEERPRVAVPLWMLFEISRPILYGLAEQLGHATTIKGAKALLQENDVLRRDLVGRVFATRPLVLGNALLGDVLTAVDVEIGDDPVIRMPPSIAKRIEVRTGSRVVVHLPLSAPGVEEARALMRGEAPNTPVREEGWITEFAATKKGAADRIVELAVARAEDPCETPFAAFLVGGWVLRQ